MKMTKYLPVDMSQKTKMGSSPIPWPSGSIHCIPDASDGFDARSSRHVLGIPLLPLD